MNYNQRNFHSPKLSNADIAEILNNPWRFIEQSHRVSSHSSLYVPQSNISNSTDRSDHTQEFPNISQQYLSSSNSINDKPS